MPVENPNFSPGRKLEHEKRKEFQARLMSILETSLTVENINTFADDALNKLVALTSDVVQKYKEEVKSDKTIGELEDEAYIYYGLLNIGELLDRAQKKVDQIKSIEMFIKEKSKFTSDVITPPDTLEAIPTSGEQTFEEKRLIPRLTTLLYILETDFSIPKDRISLVQGQVTEEMMRQTPYFRVEIKPLDRVVYVCEEEGNASYIFDVRELEKQNITLDKLDLMTKEERNELITQFPNTGRRLIQTEYWRENISELLENDINIGETGEKKTEEDLPVVSKIELDPWRGFWTDEQGRHWASGAAIAKKIGIVGESSLSKVVKDFPVKPILDLRNKRQQAYCYEEVLELDYVKDFMGKIPEPEQSGEWKGFYVDENGKHWAPLTTLSKKMVMYGPLNHIIDKNLVSSIEMRSLSNRGRTKGFCYEEILSLERVRSLRELPRIATEGEWKGFWTDDKGNHWTTEKFYCEKFSIPRRVIRRYLEKITDRLMGHDINNARVRIYCLETLEKDDEFQNLIHSYREGKFVLKEGDWKGFYIDGSGKHWGSENLISEKTGQSRRIIRRIIDTLKLTPTKVKALNGIERDGYCYEDIVSYGNSGS